MTNKRLKRLAIFLVCFMLFGIAPYTGFAIDEEATLSDEVQSPSVTVSLYVEGANESTKTTPAGAVVYPQVYGAWPRPTAKLNIGYQNLEANTTYTVRITTRYSNNSGTTSERTYAASESGSGTWAVSGVINPLTWSSDFTGEAKVSFTIADPSDETIIDYSVPENDKSMTILVRGIASMEVLTSNGINKDNLRFITKEELDEGGVISGRIKLTGLLPDTEYTINSVLSRFALSDVYYMTSGTDVSNTVSQTMKTDSDGTVVFTPEYTGIDKDKIQNKCYYTNRFTVRASDDSSPDQTSYSFFPRQIADPTFYLAAKDMLIIGEDNKPEEKPTLVEVEITNRLVGSNAVLPGSKLKVVVGDTPDGDLIEEWVQTDTAHSIKLEPGTYTLVQVSVPDGYDLAEPVVFTLSDDDAASRGYNFESGYGNTGTSFNIRKDRSDDEGEVVFCINHEKPFGERFDAGNGGLLYYSEYDIKDALLNDVIGTPRVSVDELRTKLLQITYGGYPNDKLGLKEKYDLSDSELSQATQHAIHYYTDSIGFEKSIGRYNDQFISEAAYDAYIELINTDITPPKGMTVKFYMPSNDIYQALISTYFRDDEPIAEIVIYNEKPEDEEEDQPEDKEEETKPEDKEDKPSGEEEESKEGDKSESDKEELKDDVSKSNDKEDRPSSTKIVSDVNDDDGKTAPANQEDSGNKESVKKTSKINTVDTSDDMNLPMVLVMFILSSVLFTFICYRRFIEK